MIDESMDTEQMQQPPQPWEFRSKPAGSASSSCWGIIVNLILGFTIYSMVLLVGRNGFARRTHPLRIGGGRTPEANGL